MPSLWKAEVQEQQAANRRSAKARKAGKLSGGKFTSETAAEAARKSAAVQARKRADEARREEQEAEDLARRLEQATLTVKDEAEALERLRQLAKSDDEKVATAATVKLLEYTKGRPGTGGEQGPTAIVYRTAFIAPEEADEAS